MTRADARFDDLRRRVAFRFPAPRETLAAHTHDEVRAVLERVCSRCDAGAWAFGFLAYEAGAGLDPTLPRVSRPPGVPLAWSSVGGPPRAVEPVRAPAVHPSTGPWTAEIGSGGTSARGAGRS